MNVLEVAGAGFRTLMLQNTQLAQIVNQNGQHKIFLGDAKGNYLPPYITMRKLYGGEDNVNPSRSFDMIFRIDALSIDQKQASDLYSLIEVSLVGAWPVLQDGWTAWAGITQGVPFIDTVLVQSKPYDVLGSQFRIRAVKDKT